MSDQSLSKKRCAGCKRPATVFYQAGDGRELCYDCAELEGLVVG